VLFSDAMAYSGLWGAGGTFGSWSVAADGGGGVAGLGDRIEVTGASGDRAVVTAGSYGDLDLSVRVTSVLQGGGSDTAWVIWHYADAARFQAVYVGASGWGILLVDPSQSGGVRVLAQGSNHALAAGASTTVRIRQVGTAISVWSGGALLASPDDEEARTSGAIGVASAGSTSRFDDVVVRST